MPQSTDQPRHAGGTSPRTQGRALVLLRSGHNYRADLTIVDGLVHASKVEIRLGDYRRATADRAWPPNALREIRWLDDCEAVT